MLSKIHWALAAALAAGTGAAQAAPPDWLTATLDAPCDVTDIDFSDARNGFATCAFSDVMTSADGGWNWHVIHTDLQQSLLWAHAESAEVLYAARLGFYRSDDGGQTWAELGGLSSMDNSVFDAHFFDAQHVSLLKGADLYYSENGGSDWTLVYPAPFEVYFSKLNFPSPEVGFATGGQTTERGTHGNVARTVDGGRTWTLLPVSLGRIYAADFFDDAHGVVATQDLNLYTTADGGDSWELLGPAPNGDLLLDIAHRDAAHWFAVSMGGALYETRDAGATWETAYQDPDANPLASLSLRGGAVVAGGNSGVVVVENRLFRDGFD
jgi:photosystem II stability/assembly factor-like uncharacterized protein